MTSGKKFTANRQEARKGRGALSNPDNRFQRIRVEWDDGIDEPSPVTECRAVKARSLQHILFCDYHLRSAIFFQWLQEHYPMRSKHVISLIRQSRGGADNDNRQRDLFL